MKNFHLAQLNIAEAKAPMEDEVMKGFFDRLDEINMVAEESPGFVWRLQTEDGNATSIQAFDNLLMLVNMSIWEDVEALKSFVYKTVHVELLQDRDAWFIKMVKIHQVLWWVPAGCVPTLDEASARLELLNEKGPGPDAFTFARSF
jgi:hypothetical protein